MMKVSAKTLRIIGSVVLCFALLFSLLGMGNSTTFEGVPASPFFGYALLCMAVFELLGLWYRRKTEPGKTDWMRWVYFALCLAAAALSFLIPDTSKQYGISPVLYLTIPIAKRMEQILLKRKTRAVLYHFLVLIACALSLLATLALLGYIKEGLYGACAIFALFTIDITCLTNICSMAFSRLNKEILLKIIRKTYAGEILLGLFLLIVAFSLVLMHNEESVHTFGDAMWYCFTVITTIGFGDIAAVSFVGRVLTVILGIYGIIVVSILTSIIVNFYSETKDAKEDVGSIEIDSEKRTIEPHEKSAKGKR